MATTKATTAIHSGVTLTAGAADTVSSAQDLTDGYGGVLHAKLTNGGTGPTDAAQVQVEVSSDNSEWYKLGAPLKGLTTNSGVSSWTIEIPMGVKYLRTTSGSNTDQDVTLDVDLTEVTAV